MQSLVVPLEINVALLGFNGDGAYQFQIAEKELADFLQKSLPEHRPSCLETGQQLEISYQLKYTVFHVSLVFGNARPILGLLSEISASVPSSCGDEKCGVIGDELPAKVYSCVGTAVVMHISYGAFRVSHKLRRICSVSETGVRRRGWRERLV